MLFRSLNEIFEKGNMSTGMLDMIRGFTVANLIRMAGKNMPAAMPFILNDKLNKIAK